MYYEENEVRGFRLDDGKCYHPNCIGDLEVVEENIISLEEIRDGYYFCDECKKQIA